MCSNSQEAVCACKHNAYVMLVHYSSSKKKIPSVPSAFECKWRYLHRLVTCSMSLAYDTSVLSSCCCWWGGGACTRVAASCSVHILAAQNIHVILHGGGWPQGPPHQAAPGSPSPRVPGTGTCAPAVSIPQGCSSGACSRLFPCGLLGALHEPLGIASFPSIIPFWSLHESSLCLQKSLLSCKELWEWIKQAEHRINNKCSAGAQQQALTVFVGLQST